MLDFHKFSSRISMGFCEFEFSDVLNSNTPIDWMMVLSFVSNASARKPFFSTFQRQFVARTKSAALTWAEWYINHQINVELSGWRDDFHDYELGLGICRCGVREISIRLNSKNLDGFTSYGIRFCNVENKYYICDE